MTPDAIALRDAALLRMQPLVGTDVGMLFKFLGKVPTEKEPDDQLPALLIIASQENMAADGDVTAGIPDFVNSLTLNFLVSLSGNDREACDTRLGTRCAAVLTLLKDATFVSLFEGVESINIVRVFEHDGERFFARANIAMVLQYRVRFEPILTTPLNIVRGTVVPLGTASGDVFQVEYDLPQN